MGNSFSSFVDRFFGRKRSRILMIGLDAAGKTTILYRLKINEMVRTIPTIGFNVEEVEYKNIFFTVWDIGGQDKIRPLWRHYYQNVQGIIFVIDASDRDRFAEAEQELQRIMREEALNKAVLLVFANKQDLENALTTCEVIAKLQLNQYGDRRWYVQSTCAMQGIGLIEGLEWLKTELTN